MPAHLVLRISLRVYHSRLNKRYNLLLELVRNSLVERISDVPLGILHRKMTQYNLFALDAVAEFVERIDDIFQVAVPLLFAHCLFAFVEEGAFRNEHLRLENVAVVEQTFAKAIAHEAHERFIDFARDFDTVLAEFDNLGRGFSEEFVLEFFLVKVQRAAHRRDGVLDFEWLECDFLAVSQELPVACLDGFNFRIAELRFGHSFEHGFRLDPFPRVFGDVLGHVIDAVAFDAHHLAQAVVTHEATRMVAVGVSQEHVVQGNRRKRAFTHVDAKVQFGNLDIRRESGNRESGNRRTGRINVNLPQCVVYVLVFVHFFTAR